MASRRLLKGYFVFDQKRVNRRLVTWNTGAGNSLSQLPLCARYFHKHRWRSRCEHAHSQGGKEGWAQPAAGLWLLISHADGPLSTNVYETRKRFLIALSSCWENKVKTPRSSKGWSIYLTWSYRRFPTVAHSWTPTWVWSFPSGLHYSTHRFLLWRCSALRDLMPSWGFPRLPVQFSWQ